MKYLFSFLLILPFTIQAQSVEDSLQKAKDEFVYIDRAQIESTEKIQKFKDVKLLFEQVLRDTPQCSEAHYYYGYTLDRLYSISPNPNIRDMITNPNRQDMEKISLEFAAVARAVDAGLLGRRLPRTLARGLRHITATVP